MLFVGAFSKPFSANATPIKQQIREKAASRFSGNVMPVLSAHAGSQFVT